MSQPKCPTCGWMLEFVRDTTYPERDEWVGRCWKPSCVHSGRHWSPSELGWTEERALAARVRPEAKERRV